MSSTHNTPIVTLGRKGHYRFVDDQLGLSPCVKFPRAEVLRYNGAKRQKLKRIEVDVTIQREKNNTEYCFPSTILSTTASVACMDKNGFRSSALPPLPPPPFHPLSKSLSDSCARTTPLLQNPSPPPSTPAVCCACKKTIGPPASHRYDSRKEDVDESIEIQGSSTENGYCQTSKDDAFFTSSFISLNGTTSTIPLVRGDVIAFKEMELDPVAHVPKLSPWKIGQVLEAFEQTASSITLLPQKRSSVRHPNQAKFSAATNDADDVYRNVDVTWCTCSLGVTVRYDYMVDARLITGPSLPLRRKTIQKKRAKDAKKKSTIRRKLAREAPVQQSGSKAGADISPPVARPHSQEQMPSTMAGDTAPNLTPKSALTPLQQQRSLASVLERLRRKTVTSGSPRSGSACRSSMVGKESTTSRWAIHEGNQ